MNDKSVNTGTISVAKNQMNIKELSGIIVEFFEKLSAWEESVVKDSGLTTAQNHTIEIIGDSGTMKMKDLAEKIGVTTGTLTVGIDRLEKKKLLKRVPHEKDRRSYMIELTEEGRKNLRQPPQPPPQPYQRILSDLSPEEKQIFYTAIQKSLDKM